MDDVSVANIYNFAVAAYESSDNRRKLTATYRYGLVLASSSLSKQPNHWDDAISLKSMSLRHYDRRALTTTSDALNIYYQVFIVNIDTSYSALSSQLKNNVANGQFADKLHYYGNLYNKTAIAQASCDHVVTANQEADDSLASKIIQAIKDYFFCAIPGLLLLLSCTLVEWLRQFFKSQIGVTTSHTIFTMYRFLLKAASISFTVLLIIRDDTPSFVFWILLISRLLCIIVWVIIIFILIVYLCFKSSEEINKFTLTFDKLPLHLLLYKPALGFSSSSIQTGYYIHDLLLKYGTIPGYLLLTLVCMVDITLFKLLPWINTAYSMILKGYPNFLLARLCLYPDFVIQLSQSAAAMYLYSTAEVSDSTSICFLFISITQLFQNLFYLFLYIALDAKKLKQTEALLGYDGLLKLYNQQDDSKLHYKVINKFIESRDVSTNTADFDVAPRVSESLFKKSSFDVKLAADVDDEIINVDGNGNADKLLVSYDDYTIGTKVKADYKGRGKWYSGVIVNVDSDGTYDVEYLNKKIESKVTTERLQVVEDENNYADWNDDIDDNDFMDIHVLSSSLGLVDSMLLEDIESDIKMILDKGEPYDKERLSYLQHSLEFHPDYIARKAKQVEMWEDQVAPYLPVSLENMRGFVSSSIFEETLHSLVQYKGYTKELATHLLNKKCLWLCRMSMSDISKLSIQDLTGLFNPLDHELDVVELASIYASLPDTFLNDHDKLKLLWKHDVLHKLYEMVLKLEDGTLPMKAQRNKVYKNVTPHNIPKNSKRFTVSINDHLALELNRPVSSATFQAGANYDWSLDEFNCKNNDIEEWEFRDVNIDDFQLIDLRKMSVRMGLKFEREIKIYPLEELDKSISDIMKKANSGQAYDKDFLAYLQKCLDIHPEHLKRKDNIAGRWKHKVDQYLHVCLHSMREYIPPSIFGDTIQSLMEEQGYSKALAKRLCDKKCLWLCRINTTDISKMHMYDLQSMFHPLNHSLDVVELAAIYASLPDVFDKDVDDEKLKWKLSIMDRLKELISKSENGTLPSDLIRNIAYKNQVPGFVGRQTLHALKKVRVKMGHLSVDVYGKNKKKGLKAADRMSKGKPTGMTMYSQKSLSPSKSSYSTATSPSNFRTTRPLDMLGDIESSLPGDDSNVVVDSGTSTKQRGVTFRESMRKTSSPLSTKRTSSTSTDAVVRAERMSSSPSSSYQPLKPTAPQQPPPPPRRGSVFTITSAYETTSSDVVSTTANPYRASLISNEGSRTSIGFRPSTVSVADNIRQSSISSRPSFNPASGNERSDSIDQRSSFLKVYFNSEATTSGKKNRKSSQQLADFDGML